MVYILSRKYLEKHIQKLVIPNDYVIIDGENYGNNANGTSDPLSQKYNHVIVRGGLSPERDTLNIFRQIKSGKDYSEKKLKLHLEEFFDSDELKEGCFACIKAQLIYEDDDINVFVVLPTLVYKMIGEKYTNYIQKISKCDFQFVFGEKDIKESKKMILKNKLKKKQLKEIGKIVHKVEKKFKNRCRLDDDYD